MCLSFYREEITMITFKNNEFHLETDNTSYIIGIFREKYLTHLYWGKKLNAESEAGYILETMVADRPGLIHNEIDEERKLYLSDIPLEFSTVSGGIYRVPTFHALYADKSTVSDFTYESYKIFDGKKRLKGLPAVYTEDDSEAQTLEICLKDNVSGMKAYLCYTVMPSYDVITRSIRYENGGNDTVTLLSAQSSTVDFYAPDFELMHINGDWEREGCVERTKLDHITFTIDSKKGASSAMQQPFAALVSGNADEDSGEVYGFSLVYSGSFSIQAEPTSTGLVRINAGLQTFDFGWELKAGESFQTPEAVMVYSDAGIGKMSRTYHKVYRERLCRGMHRDAERPLVLNPWAAYGLSCSAENMYDEAVKAAEMGFEMFVLDDGWFGKDVKPGVRPLGDWFANEEKFPGGLAPLAERITSTGLKFGLWFEPEIISPDSKLYKEHPDWCLCAPGRESTQMYHQLHLDMSKPEVREYLINAISKMLDTVKISYIKWDYNRAMIETQNRQKQHKSMLGTYEVLETLTRKYPYVLFEGCSSGGGRFDPGMLYYMPQTWTSDNQYAITRTKIQHGLSMVYPSISMTAHAGEIPTGFNAYNNALNTSAMVAMSANFGYEMALVGLSEEETRQSEEYIKCYKAIRGTVQFGEMYRIGNPYSEERIAVEYVDGTQAVLFTYQLESQKNGFEWRVKLRGLDENAMYECNGKVYSGELLMRLGIRITLEGYEHSCGCRIFRKI